MKTSAKESPFFAPNLQRETPSNRVLLDMFSTLADRETLFFCLTRDGLGLRVSARLEGYVPSDPARVRGMEYLSLSAAYDGKLLVIDTTPLAVNNHRESWFKKKSHPDVVFWAEAAGASEVTILYGRGEYAGVSGLWTPFTDGSMGVDVSPKYCDYATRRAFSFYSDELKSASQREPGAKLILQMGVSPEPPSDLYNLN